MVCLVANLLVSIYKLTSICKTKGKESSTVNQRCCVRATLSLGENRRDFVSEITGVNRGGGIDALTSKLRAHLLERTESRKYLTSKPNRGGNVIFFAITELAAF